MLISNTVYLGSAKATSGTPQYKVMPTPTRAGDIVQYVGETTSDYHKGYFYESYQDGTVPSVATISQTVGEGLEDLAVNKTTFETQITESGTYDFIARLNREHITATIGTDTVRMDRDESHDVEGAVAWTPDGETYFYTEELVPDVADDVFEDPDGETVAGAVASYSTEAIGWEFDGEFVDISDYGITYTPADPEATVEYSSEALGTVTVDADTFATQVAESDLYIFDCRVTEDTTKWYRGADEITLATYGITITGAAEDGNTIHIEFVSEPPHQDDVIEVTYAEAYPTYDWRRINVQPSGGGSGAVNSVNDIEPDEDGNVELSAENIDAEVGGTVDSVQAHLDSLRTDLGDLADDVDLKVTKPTVETITGNTPTIANVQGNHIYNCTGTLTSLTLTAVETTYTEATIYMTTGASITVNVPASVKTIGYTEFSPNTSYVISFANGTMVIGEINA